MIEESSRFEIGNLLPAKVKLDIIIKLGSQFEISENGYNNKILNYQFEIVLLPAKVRATSPQKAANWSSKPS